ncbi:prokineticin 2 [Turdus rufiventris]|nr:prokineticin 2 [Turdus rufiventris]
MRRLRGAPPGLPPLLLLLLLILLLLLAAGHGAVITGACDRDQQCGGGMCCAVSLWIRSLRMCTPMGNLGDECHPLSHREKPFTTLSCLTNISWRSDTAVVAKGPTVEDAFILGYPNNIYWSKTPPEGGGLTIPESFCGVHGSSLTPE